MSSSKTTPSSNSLSATRVSAWIGMSVVGILSVIYGVRCYRKSKAKQARLAAKKVDPHSLQLEPATVELFTNYATLINLNPPSVSSIKSRAIIAREKMMVLHPYPCITEFRFLNPRCLTHPQYQSVIKPLLNSSTRLLDLGCCTGTDLRQHLVDGAKSANCLGVDLLQEFIDIGLDILYQDRLLMQNQFVAANLLNKTELYAKLRSVSTSTSTGTMISATGIPSVDLIYTGSLIHLFSEADSQIFVQICYELLATKGIFYGRTIVSTEANVNINNTDSTTSTNRIDARINAELKYLHTESSLRDLLARTGFTGIEMSNPTVEPTLQSEHWRGKKFCCFLARKL